jgi:hypothetical protein
LGLREKELVLIDLINCSSIPDAMKQKTGLMISERIKVLGFR